MFSQPGMGYDMASTVFSPDGRLFQVEYAIEAVRRGTIAIALKNKEGVVFCVERRDLPLQENIGSEKIFKIDDHIGVAIAGLTADARTLVEQARVHAQVNILSYNQKVSVLECTRDLCDQMQLYTQQAGARPFGVSLLVGGIDPDNGTKIFMTDPSGAFWGYHACAIGNNAQNARDFLEREYDKDMSLEDLELLAIKTLKEVADGDVEENKFEIAVVSKDEDFHLIDESHQNELIEKL